MTTLNKLKISTKVFSGFGIGLSLPAYFAAINRVPDDFFEGQETQILSAEDRRSLNGDVVGSIQKGGLDRESRLAQLLDQVAAIGAQAS
jgi:hypothetical protein